MRSYLPGIIIAAIVGIAVGIALYTFVYAKGGSYLSNDPAACANCHIMDEHYSAWLKSSHHTVATCNDCHTPHTFLGKYAVKASNGFWHSFAFTTGDFPDPLRIKEGNREVTEEACRYCHADITAMIEGPQRTTEETGNTTGHPEYDGADYNDELNALSCIRCHRTVGHWVR